MNPESNTDDLPAVSSDVSKNAIKAPSLDADQPIPATRTLTWEALSQGGRHLLIHYNGQEYHLRETRNGKLILTK